MNDVKEFHELFDRITRALGQENDKLKFIPFKELVKMSTNPLVRAHQKELTNFADLRNLNAHSNDIADYFAAPHPFVLNHLREIAEKIAPKKKVFDICVKDPDIFRAQPTDPLSEISSVMIEKVYTHVPLVDETGVISGVFSESTVFNSIGLVDIKSNSMIRDFNKFLSLDGRPNEVYDFVSHNALFEEVKEKFIHPFREKKRLGVVFVTDTGDKNGRLLGMVTAWDMLN